MPLITCQQQSFSDVFQKRLSYKFHRFHRKTSALESLLNKAAGHSPISQENTCVGVSF